MKNIFYNELYQKDLELCKEEIERLRDSSILITGANGLIGSFIVDAIYRANVLYNTNIKIYALSRNYKRLENRFIYDKEKNISYIEQDINKSFDFDFNVDYIIHAASNAYPSAIYNDPVGTILSNIHGTYNLLNYMKKINGKRMLFVSTGEVYGNSIDNIEAFREEDSGIVDILNIRSSYPISKRCAENLCISYANQFEIDVVISRLCHVYGPNNSDRDNRANVQFINDAVSNRNIILKSKGEQIRSYIYISDCVSGILKVLLDGNNKEAYNIANKDSILSIANFAEKVATIASTKVIYKISNEEKTLFSRAVLDSKKLELLKWIPYFNIDEGIKHTLEINKWLKNK